MRLCLFSRQEICARCPWSYNLIDLHVKICLTAKLSELLTKRMAAMKKRVILQEQDISQCMQEMANRITERNASTENVVLVGIRTGGAFLAARLQGSINRLNRPAPPLGILDITLYRDDWTRIGPTPLVRKTDLPFSVDDKTVILVDDVLFTGRTVRAAMDALIDYGRPRKIELAVLVDRGEAYRELPIMANYVGGVWNTEADETINVYLKEAGFDDHVAIEGKKAA
jgi:pyrimidine operon attenuation protein/uracil phosphoribosyltransferase